MYMLFLNCPVCSFLDVCAAHGEAVPLGKSSGEWLGLWWDVLGSGPPQRERHGRTWLSQSCLATEEALLEQRHCPSQVSTVRWVTGAKVLGRGEHVSHRQQQQHLVAPAGMCFGFFPHWLVCVVLCLCHNVRITGFNGGKEPVIEALDLEIG